MATDRSFADPFEPTFARFWRFRGQDRGFERLEQGWIAPRREKGGEAGGWRLSRAETGRFACTQAHLCRHCPALLVRRLVTRARVVPAANEKRTITDAGWD